MERTERKLEPKSNKSFFATFGCNMFQTNTSSTKIDVRVPYTRHFLEDHIWYILRISYLKEFSTASSNYLDIVIASNIQFNVQAVFSNTCHCRIVVNVPCGLNMPKPNKSLGNVELVYYSRHHRHYHWQLKKSYYRYHDEYRLEKSIICMQSYC
ncbi:hypothetical protein BDC45DRAFT_537561 [Circinella umbellata]|nr:hypothetical protein BDC45DRAFT_537561 [Circinella umbellata]